MKMYFQVMKQKPRRNRYQQNKEKHNNGWKHVIITEFLRAATARREEAMFFSLFYKNYR